MKKILIFFIAITTGLYTYSQDTIRYLTSGCLLKKEFTNSCPEGVFFSFVGDSMKIYGAVEANCCGVHLAKVEVKLDTVFINTLDTGSLCKCVCAYCFEIKVKMRVVDLIMKVKMNGVVYKSDESAVYVSELDDGNSDVKLYPNPVTDKIIIMVKDENRIKNVKISDVSGRFMKLVDSKFESIDMSGWNAGVYLVDLELKNDKHVIKKLLKR